MAIRINPQIEEKALLDPGEYADGKDSVEVILETCEEKRMRWPKEADEEDRPMGLHLCAVVKHPDKGFVRVHAEKDYQTKDQGSSLPRWLAQLGVPREAQIDGFEPKDLLGTKCLVNVGVRQYTNNDGEQVFVNNLRDIHRIA